MTYSAIADIVPSTKEREELQASTDDWPMSPVAPVSERAARAFRALGIWDA